MHRHLIGHHLAAWPTEQIDWLNKNTGSVQVLVALVTALLTGAYVLLTHSLVRESRRSIEVLVRSVDEAHEANRLSFEALAFEQERAAHDRQQAARVLEESVRSRLDSLTPTIVLDARSIRVEEVVDRRATSTIDLSDPEGTLCRILVRFEVRHSGGPSADVILNPPGDGQWLGVGPSGRPLERHASCVIHADERLTADWVGSRSLAQVLSSTGLAIGPLEVQSRSFGTGVTDHHTWSRILHWADKGTGESVALANLRDDTPCAASQRREYPTSAAST